MPGRPRPCLGSHSQLALSALALAYVLLGGLLFQRLEAGHELRQRAVVRSYRDQCLRELWLITERLNVLYERNWTRLVDAQLRQFERSVVEASRAAGHQLRDSDLRWTYTGALLYSVTVVTTIGYGNVAPRTAEGKVVTMVYALIGVPLMLMCLSNLGNALAHSFQTTYSRVCCPPATGKQGMNLHMTKRCGRGGEGVVAAEAAGAARGTLVAVGPNAGRPVCSLTPEARQLLKKHQQHQHLTQHDRESDDDDPDLNKGPCQHDTPTRVPLIWRAPGESRRAPTPPPRRTPPLRPPPARVPLAVVALLLAAYLAVGALSFAAWEGWSLLDGAYFCFVTLTTIGFGDRSLRPGSLDAPLHAAACCAYLLLGLVVVAMAFSLLQDEVVARGRHLATAVGLVRRPERV